jgi:hypothetical protein
MISSEDLHLFKIVNSPKEAFDYLKEELTEYIDIEQTLLNNKKLKQ